ncbi:MAG: 2'-deoxycytidine 5'-triphosphate deaminase [Polyangiaceae bacterium]|nr:2'-deoxycytidine 5'-triphosphate deaminase [Polyangiaceae bacterium]
MAKPPWFDWLPGVLNREQVKRLQDWGCISGRGVDKPDLSSIDLHLTNAAWELTDGSYKPMAYYERAFLKPPFARPLELVDGAFTLTPARTYVFKLDEKLLGFSDDTPIWGQATAKSSVGRVDVLARLIVDGMNAYEAFSPGQVKAGDMFLEVTSLTFLVRVKPGESLSQLRLFHGPPNRSEVRGRELLNTILPKPNPIKSDPEDCLLRVELGPSKIGGAAFRAKNGVAALPPIDLWEKEKTERPNPKDYWEIEKSKDTDDHKHLKLDKNAFYILRSYDLLALTKSVAGYCRAIDETIGEMRIHYAGFVHPYFGRNRADKNIGTPLIFEVRGHDLSVNLVQEEVMAKMTLYRMSEDATLDDKLDNPDASPYGNQELNLSKFFAPWPG